MQANPGLSSHRREARVTRYLSPKRRKMPNDSNRYSSGTLATERLHSPPTTRPITSDGRIPPSRFLALSARVNSLKHPRHLQAPTSLCAIKRPSLDENTNTSPGQ